MKIMMGMASLLLMSAVFTAPASANYFSNPRTGIELNIGSAKSPTPEMLRLTGDHVIKRAGPVVGSAEDQDYADDAFIVGNHQTIATVRFTDAQVAAMDGKTLIGAKGEHLGVIIAVDQGSHLLDLQTPGGVAVSVPAVLVSDKGKTLTAKTMSKADVMAMAKTQTGRTVALNLGVRGSKLRASRA